MEFSAGIEMQANFSQEAEANIEVDSDLAAEENESLPYDQESDEDDMEIEVVYEGSTEQKEVTPLEKSVLEPQVEIVISPPEIVIDEVGVKACYENETNKGYQSGLF